MDRESDYAEARERMVQTQLAVRGITDARVLNAMRRVLRHHFVPEEQAAQAYADHPLPIGYNQTISQPYMVALLAQMLKLTGSERVLDVGTGSGYQAAVLSLLCREVISIERNVELAHQARATLEREGFLNVRVLHGDGTQGAREDAPFDRIVVAAAAMRVPGPLITQIAPEGRLVMPIGETDLQTLTVITKDAKGGIFTHEHGGCLFVPLIPGEPL